MLFGWKGIPMCKRSSGVLLFWLLAVWMGSSASAKVWYVDDDAPHDPGPGDPYVSDPDADGSAEHPFDKIADGILFAQPGDVVIVRDGTYSEWGNYNLNFLGKAITVRSENGPANCVIDCADLGRAFHFHTSESAATIVEGFTIINGTANKGGGMYFAATTNNPTIRNCWFINCTATGAGGGGAVCTEGCAPTFADCVFIGNTAESSLGALSCLSGTVQAERCRFIDNVTTGIYSQLAALTLNNCLIAGNTKRGLLAYAGQVNLKNCTIAHNTAPDSPGAGIYAYAATVNVDNSILWGNLDATGDPYGTDVQASGVSQMRYSCMQGLPEPAADGNIGANPLFRDPFGADSDPLTALDNDYRLDAGSPCVDAGDNALVPVGTESDCDGAPRFVDDPLVPDTGLGTPPIVDMGAFERQVVVPDGDFDADQDVDMDDVFVFLGCLAGPDVVVAELCEPGDFDGDRDVDLADFAVFQTLFTGPLVDCNDNGIPDDEDIASGYSQDCNGNGIPDECDIADGTSQDCNGNGVPDECDIAGGYSLDCNGNGIPDECDIAGGYSLDCNDNGVPDECDIASGYSLDCNGNGIPDECDIASGYSQDCNGNGIPDECDIADGTSEDCQPNGVPDECDLAGGALHASLVHRWSFDGDATDSLGGAHGVLMGGASIVDGAVALDGVDGYVELPIADTIAALDSITLEAWVEWDGGGNWQRVFDIGTNTTNYMFFTPFNGGPSRFAIRTPSVGEQMLDGPALPTGQMKHVAITIKAANTTAILYIDGSPIDENNEMTLRPSDLGSATIGYLGKSFWPDPYLAGRITEFRIYGAALDELEIADSWAAGFDAQGATSFDCNGNGIPDECDIASGYSQDLNDNGIPDECEAPLRPGS